MATKSPLRDAQGRNKNVMKTVNAFYELNEKNHFPPSAQELADRLAVSIFTVYRHLTQAVEYGYLKYDLINVTEDGKRGIRAYHPVPRLHSNHGPVLSNGHTKGNTP